MVEHASASAVTWDTVPEEEKLTLENTSIRVSMWPRIGGKIVSIMARTWSGEHELLHPPIQPYNAASRTSSFAASDAGGWDECLPSVAACTYQQVKVPDHGDVWRRPWLAGIERNSIAAHVCADSLPLRFSRSISLDGESMHLRYNVMNTGTYATDFLWSVHPLLQVEQGDRILLPESIERVRVEGSSEDRLALSDHTCSWPNASLDDGGYLDLSTVGPKDGRTSHKLFAGPLATGWCGLYRAHLKLGILFRFDPARTPFAGIWISQGAWPATPSGDARRRGKQYTVALEPTTAPCDALDAAARTGHVQHLLPQAELSWPLHLQVCGCDRPISYEEFHAVASKPSGSNS